MFIKDDELISQFKQLNMDTNIQLTSEQKEIVDKAVELSECVFKRNDLSTESKIAMFKDGGNKLQFSESSISAGANGYQFSIAGVNDVDPLLGNTTMATLGMIIQEVGSSLKKDGILSMMFPDKSVPEYRVILDRIAPNSGIAGEIGGDNGIIPNSRPLDSFRLEYQAGLWGVKTSLHSRDIMFNRKYGEKNFDLRGIGQLVAYNTVRNVTQCLTRKKKLLSDAIFNNGFVYGGANVSSNIPTANYISLSSAMGTLATNGRVTYSNGDPLYNPVTEITNILANPIFYKYRAHIKGFVMNNEDLRAIMNHPNVKAATNYLMMGSLRAGTEKLEVIMNGVSRQITAYYAPSFDIPFIADDEVWIQSNLDGTKKTTPNDATTPNLNAQQFFIPRGKIFVLLDLTSTGGQAGAFHLTYNQVDPNTTSPSMGLFTGVFNRNLHNSDNTINRLDIVSSISGAPAVYMPEACFVITGLYTN